VSIIVSVLLAFVLDRLLGEPKRFHPLIGFGRLANVVEAHSNKGKTQRVNGVMAVLIVIVPCCVLVVWLERIMINVDWLYPLFAGFILYLAIGWQSLLQHALAIAKPLAAGDMDLARQAVAMIVSRDTANLGEKDIAKAATESVLENGADAIFSALFWFLVAGVPGVVLYRLSNTLDAMWGYKNERFLLFGWAAARLDDVLNFMPARLTALSYALVGHTSLAWQCWRQQASDWKSPNAGPVMAAGAGALNVSLGGAARYHDQPQVRPTLGVLNGEGEQVSAGTIKQACKLINRAICLWIGVLVIGVAVL